MAVKQNTTLQANINANVREIDFVSRFQRNWESLQELLGISRPIRKTPGTKLAAYNATVALQDGAVAEGDEIPYSLATVAPVAFTDLVINKYAKGTSIEAVNTYGAEIAVQKTDDAFLNEITGKILENFITALGTGTLTDNAATFQAAVALAIGKVRDAFKKMHRDYGEVVVFVNTLDAYAYLGQANITIQNDFGIEYVENFMGARLILSSDIEQGKVIATPRDNLVLYYVDPSDAQFERLGLDYTVVGPTSLIGAHVNGRYSHAVGEMYAVVGMTLWFEYVNGVAVISIGA